ncbi:MAG: hypothetical protein N3B15_08185 [Planctomycetota bacterium]|nr:hypothetical protein [Planctomycetota bacterium]
MRIVAGQWSIAGVSAQLAAESRRERLESWVGERPRPANEALSAPGGAAPAAEGRELALHRALERAAKSRTAPPQPEGEPPDPETLRILAILERLFGDREARRFVLRLQQLALERAQAASDAPELPAASGIPPRSGWGLLYEAEQWSIAAQSAALVAEGQLTLADGRQLSFSLTWVQSAVQVQSAHTRLALGDARLKDPLVFDLDGDGIRWEGATVRYDLEGDGVPDAVPLPAGADRILLLDGRVLGARSGQAFRELAALDADGNGWIDAGDPAFARLALWNGREESGLAAAGIAAVATTSVLLPYQHRDARDSLQALGRRAGLYLTAQGRAGAIAQVDLVI